MWLFRWKLDNSTKRRSFRGSMVASPWGGPPSGPPEPNSGGVVLYPGRFPTASHIRVPLKKHTCSISWLQAGRWAFVSALCIGINLAGNNERSNACISKVFLFLFLFLFFFFETRNKVKDSIGREKERGRENKEIVRTSLDCLISFPLNYRSQDKNRWSFFLYLYIFSKIRIYNLSDKL